VNLLPSIDHNLKDIMTGASLVTASCQQIALSIACGETSALQLTREVLARIDSLDSRYNSFTCVTHERALAEAQAIDNMRSKGAALPPLAGVPYAVKNLFDIADVVTLAGSKINASHPPALEDALLIKRMGEAGAVLVGALNMDEYAYGFTTENSHYGATRNPHDVTRSAGGSSGGCGAAVAAGLVPLALGSDTNGSVRVPSSMCGVFGIKPTYGNLSLEGMYPFVHSLDHAGIFARTSHDLITSYALLAGQALSNPAPSMGELKIAIAADYFEQGEPQANVAVQAVATALNVKDKVILPEVARARSAAYLITASEGANMHHAHLRDHLADFDPHTRPRLIAGAMIPADWVIQAQRFRSWFYQSILAMFNEVDIILAPATPCSAQLLGQENMVINGKTMPTRPNIGMFTQPISFIGLPVVTVPIQNPNGMPIGVQIIAAPHKEHLALAVASYIEALGVAHAPVVTN
jgi:AtzE family amidohydrolase